MNLTASGAKNQVGAAARNKDGRAKIKLLDMKLSINLKTNTLT